MPLKAKEGCCEEQADGAPDFGYFPCNRLCDGKHYRHKYRHSEGTFRFCEPHAYHSVKNRNFEEVPDVPVG
jgi:hypothetical protein